MMKKLINLFSMFALVAIQLPLISCAATEQVKKSEQRLMIIDELKFVLGLFDEKDYLPRLQPIFDEDYNLVLDNTDQTCFDDPEFLDKTFLNERKTAKNSFIFSFLTDFLKLIPNEDQEFDLSNILLKINKTTYLKIITKTLENSSKKIITFTNGLINMVFLNKTSNAEIDSFFFPIKDIEVDIFNEIFNHKYCFDISEFEIGKKITDVRVKLSQSSELVKKLQNILNNFNFKLDDLINFNIKWNREKSNIDNSQSDAILKQKAFVIGDAIDIEIILNGDIRKTKTIKL